MSDNYIGPLESSRSFRFIGMALVALVVLFHLIRLFTPSCTPPPSSQFGLSGVPCRVLLSLDDARLGFGNTIIKTRGLCHVALAPACDTATDYARIILGLN